MLSWIEAIYASNVMPAAEPCSLVAAVVAAVVFSVLSAASVLAVVVVATVLPGVRVGRHAVVGAASVVTKDVPDYAVAVGNPAKVIKMLDKEKFQENEA